MTNFTEALLYIKHLIQIVIHLQPNEKINICKKFFFDLQ